MVGHRGRGRRRRSAAGRRADPPVRLARHLPHQPAAGPSRPVAGAAPHPGGPAPPARAQSAEPCVRCRRAVIALLCVDPGQRLRMGLVAHPGRGARVPARRHAADTPRAAPRRADHSARAVPDHAVCGGQRRGLSHQPRLVRPIVPAQPVPATGPRRRRPGDRHPTGAHAGGVLHRQPDLEPHIGALERIRLAAGRHPVGDGHEPGGPGRVHARHALPALRRRGGAGEPGSRYRGAGDDQRGHAGVGQASRQ
ncbi:Uncharacterised protein [Achromobacter xylosoxidans]|nr:Uncharacterised protein [Achromobacter xylosoxidans]